MIAPKLCLKCDIQVYSRDDASCLIKRLVGYDETISQHILHRVIEHPLIEQATVDTKLYDLKETIDSFGEDLRLMHAKLFQGIKNYWYRQTHNKS